MSWYPGARGGLTRAIVFPPGSADLLGVTCAIPAQPEVYLERLYGEGWRVPDPYFSHAWNVAAYADIRGAPVASGRRPERGAGRAGSSRAGHRLTGARRRGATIGPCPPPVARRGPARGALPATARAAAARRADAPARPRGVRRPGPPRRRARPAAPERRPRPPLLDPAVGPAGHRQDQPRPAPRQRDRRRTSSRSRRSCPASSRSARRSPRRRTGWPSTGRGPSCSSTRSIASTRPSRTPCCPHVEDGTVTLIGATTENPYFEVNAALLSRMRVWRLEALTDDEVATVVRRALADAERGLAGALGPTGGVALADDAFDHLVSLAGGDARTALNVLEGATALAEDEGVRDADGHVSPAARGRRGGRPAADPRLRPRRRRPLRHGVGVHQEPARQRPRRRALLARRDDRRRRGPPVHRPAADHQRVGGRRQRRSARAPGRGRRRRRRSTGSGCRRRSTPSPRRRPTSRRRRSRTGPAPPTGRPSPTSRRTARCRSRSTCATPAIAG